MKTWIFFFSILFFCSFLTAQSPSYVDFEWDIIKLGFVLPMGDNQEGGVTFGGELRYNATDNFSLGLSAEWAAFGDDINGDVDFGVTGSYLMVGDYYLKNDSATRAFFGGGLGLFGGAEIRIKDNNVEDVISGDSGFGIAPRAGFEFGHVRLLGQFNIPFEESLDNYIELTLALTLWGGYKGGE